MLVPSFTKTLTAGILSLTLGLTSLAPAPAHAGLSDDEKLGLITLLLFGAAIHNNRNRDEQPQETRPRRDWRVLPSDCLRQAHNRRGERVRFFAQRCLNNSYAHVNRLPQACHIRFRTDVGQRRQGYNPRCLRNAGFRTDRR